jgi:hypothetical protein
VLITCISPSEADFEETNNTLKYANRACSIQNQPLPNKFLMMEEDLLPTAPGGGAPSLAVAAHLGASAHQIPSAMLSMPVKRAKGVSVCVVARAALFIGPWCGAGDTRGVVSIEALLEENFKQRDLREKRKREKEEKERVRKEALSVKKEQLMKTKGCVSDLNAAPADSSGCCSCVWHGTRPMPHELVPSLSRHGPCRYQRLLAQEYDRKLKEARRSGKRRFNVNETVDGQHIVTPDYNGNPGFASGGYPSGQLTSNGQFQKDTSSHSAGFNLQEFIRMRSSAEPNGVCFARSRACRCQCGQHAGTLSPPGI